eukprot:NODE_227_length_13866_cov_0.400305.p5 type:complete len:368 gc:universal NODE_227_length_13866_cov_0.400305:12106-11003(-)
MSKSKEMDLFGVEDDQEKDLFGGTQIDDAASPVKNNLSANKADSLEDAIFGAAVAAPEPADDIMEIDDIEIEKEASPVVHQKDISMDFKHVAESQSSNDADDIDIHVTLPSYPYPLIGNSMAGQIKLVKGVQIDPNCYTGNIEGEDELSALGTIRWGYQEINKSQVICSNTRLVEWEDGSYSMAIGNELFDLHCVKDKQKMFMSVKEQEIYNCVYEIENKYFMSNQNFGSKFSVISRKQRRKKANSVSNAKEILINEDPEAAGREAERIELEKEKLERRLEKRKSKGLAYDGYEVEDFQADYSDEEEEEDYDEGDDFIVADDQKVEEFDDFEKELEKGADVQDTASESSKKQKVYTSNIVFSSEDEQ